MSWILIGVLAVIVIAGYYNFRSTNHKFNSYLVVILSLFLIISILYVYVSRGADLSSFDGLVGFGKAYFSWAGGVFHNIVRVTGYAINQDWGVNSTIGK